MSTPNPATATPADFPNTTLSAPPGSTLPPSTPPAGPSPRQPDPPELAAWLAHVNVAREDITILTKVLTDHGDEIALWFAQARVTK